MDRQQLNAYLLDVFPELFPTDHSPYDVVSINENEAVLALQANETHLRPGGTVSGPALMTLADLAMYVVILGHIGPVALAVTTNLNINFMRKPSTGRLLGTARLLKLGRSLAVGDVSIASEIEPEKIVAHASLTYSIPPQKA
ncbi:MAG: PaaI family thioesterase [Rhizobiales bacterium]|nr:PaaI family thioesterase [Hyphomicrobiales bacterium]